MTLTKLETRDLYRKRALRYDLAMWIYRLTGFRVNKYRCDAVGSLSLKEGETVIDLACGTGLNFRWLEKAVGNTGKIIGVDLTDEMLNQARGRVQDAGWANIELVQADLAEYDFPNGVKGILSTLAMPLVPEYDEVIRNGATALMPSGRMAILDFKEPENWPKWLVRFAAWLNKPYGVSLDLTSRHPWESISRYLSVIEYREYYHGVLYLSVGETLQ